MRVKSLPSRFLPNFGRRLCTNTKEQHLSLSRAGLPGQNFPLQGKDFSLKPKYCFSTSQSTADPNLYNEAAKLQSDTISSILRKKVRAPTPQPTINSTDHSSE